MDAAGAPVDEAVSTHRPEGVLDACLVDLLSSRDVRCERAGERKEILRHDRELPTQLLA